MISLLIAISFILHLLAFFWIILLTVRIKRSNEIEVRQAQVQREIEDMFQAYLLEMKEENEKLLNTIQKSGNNNKVKTTVPAKQRVNVNELIPDQPEPTSPYKPSLFIQGKRVEQIYKSQKPQQPRSSTLQEKQTDYQPPIPVGEDQFEQSLTSQVIRLHEKGFEINEIARKLNKGKTEIELLLKFREQSK